MKLYLDRDEYWPFMELKENSRFGHQVELSEDEWEHYKTTMAQFYAWQERLREMHPKERRHDQG